MEKQIFSDRINHTEARKLKEGDMSEYKLQKAFVSEATRDDLNVNNDVWETISESDNPEDLLAELVSLANDEMLDTVNMWLRVIKDNQIWSY